MAEQGAEWKSRIPASNDQARKCSYLPEKLMYKNRLQEHSQKLHKTLPKYHTNQGGVQHGLRFQSSVEVGGEIYESPNVYSNKKESHQDAARVALEALEQKRRNEGCPLTPKDLMMCKLMLNEYAMKTNKARPSYIIRQLDGAYILYVASVEFDGVTYTGEAGNSKQASEQLAARDIIMSLSGNPDTGPIISEIINSKRVNSAMPETENLDQICHRPMPAGWGQGKDNNDSLPVAWEGTRNTLPVAWEGTKAAIAPLAGKRGADPGSSSGEMKKVRVNSSRTTPANSKPLPEPNKPKLRQTSGGRANPTWNQINKPKRNTWVAFN